MNKKMCIIATMLSLAFGIYACGGDETDNNVQPEASISLNVSELSFDGNAGEQSLTVTASQEWGTIVSDSWITVTPNSSVDNTTTIEVSVQKSDEYDAREGNVIFKCGAARATLIIKQEGGDGVPDPNAIVCPISGYELVWNDEFDQQSKDLDGNHWTHEVQKSGWVNNELQNYVNTKSPSGKRVTEVKDGTLRINCFQEEDDNGVLKVYSGRVYANVSTGWQYGYIEAKIKLPKGKGTWPAFWMMPVNVDWTNEGWPKCGEIDIMEEVGYNPNYVSSSLHAEGHVHTNNTQVTHEMYCEGAEDDFHTYAIEWTKQGITTYVDGKIQLSYDSDGTVTNYPYDKPFYVILNLAWGGSWGGAQGVDTNALPLTMEVDYVRVFQKK